MRSNPIKLLLSRLHAHPLQPEFFDDSAVEDKELAEDLRRNGQRDPVIVLPEGNRAGLPAFTIIDGHRRARLLREIGMSEVLVIVRADLKDASVAQVEAEFLRFNSNRRQLCPLDRAHRKAVDGNREVQVGEPVQLLGPDGTAGPGRRGHGHVRSKSRQVSSGARTPRSPPACRGDGRLKLVSGARLASLAQDQQTVVVERIAGIADRKEVERIVAEFIAPAVESPRRGHAVLDALVRGITRSLDDLEDRLEEISPTRARSHLESFTRAQRVIGSLIKLASSGATPQEQEQNLRKLLGETDEAA